MTQDNAHKRMDTVFVTYNGLDNPNGLLSDLAKDIINGLHVSQGLIDPETEDIDKINTPLVMLTDNTTVYYGEEFDGCFLHLFDKSNVMDSSLNMDNFMSLFAGKHVYFVGDLKGGNIINDSQMDETFSLKAGDVDDRIIAMFQRIAYEARTYHHFTLSPTTDIHPFWWVSKMAKFSTLGEDINRLNGEPSMVSDTLRLGHNNDYSNALDWHQDKPTKIYDLLYISPLTIATYKKPMFKASTYNNEGEYAEFVGNYELMKNLMVRSRFIAVEHTDFGATSTIKMFYDALIAETVPFFTMDLDTLKMIFDETFVDFAIELGIVDDSIDWNDTYTVIREPDVQMRHIDMLADIREYLLTNTILLNE